MANTDIKGIIFDYGGTIDSRGDHWSEVIWDGYRSAGLGEIGKDTFREAYVYAERYLATHPVIEPTDNFHTLLYKKMLIELDWLIEAGHIESTRREALAQAIADYCYGCARNCADEAKGVLERLKARYPMVLVSNFYGNIEAVLADFGLDHLFKAIIESAVVGIRKPDPAIFAMGVDALGMKPEHVMVVGDSFKKDIQPSLSIGCQVAWLKGKGWTAEEDAVTHPSIISSLTDLEPMLLGD